MISKTQKCFLAKCGAVSKFFSQYMKLLVTGSAGFIGFHIIKNLLNKKFTVFGVDNLNKYYDRNLKLKRLKMLKKNLRKN